MRVRVIFMEKFAHANQNSPMLLALKTFIFVISTFFRCIATATKLYILHVDFWLFHFFCRWYYNKQCRFRH